MKRAFTVIGIGMATLLASEVTSKAADETMAARRPPDADTGPSFMLGLHQWLVMGGGNVAFQYKTSRWVFEASHGQSLHLNRAARLTLTSDERQAGVRAEMPWTTGGGAGVRITRNLHALVEVKVHKYEIYGADRNQSVSYLTFTVGPGLFYEIHVWRGLFLQPVVRWWPNVADTLNEESAPAFTRPDGTLYRPKAKTQGVFANVNLGWSF
jgi:hypothetical protein